MVLLLGIGAASAHVPARAVDPRDARTRLDLRYVEAARPNQPLRIRVGVWRAWDERLLAGSPVDPSTPPRGSSFLILFDVDHDGRADYTGRTVWRGLGLSLWLAGGGSQFEPLAVRRPDARTVEVVIPGNAPMNPADRDILIAASTVDNVTVGPAPRYFTDRVPNDGWLRVPRPGR